MLGPVEAWDGDRRLDIGHSRQRCLLALLVLELNRVVPIETLIDRLWGERVPASARNVLYGHVTRLRTVLTAATGTREVAELIREGGGYLLKADPAASDLHEFRRLVRIAQGAADDEAAGLFRQALALWRGPALGGVPCVGLDGPRTALEAERLSAVLASNEVDLRRGKHRELLGELWALADEHPLDEQLARQLMLAAYRSGRQAEALRHYQRIRELLSADLGVDPAPDLQELHLRILRGDRGLAVPPPAGAARRSAAARAAATGAADPQAGAGGPVPGGPVPGGPVPGGAEPGGAGRPPPAQLPRDVPGFTGREQELEAIQRDRHGGVVVVSALDGAAGIGKTALAVHFGHVVAGDYPDGQLHVNLRGFDPHRPPLSPGEALGQLLRGLGLDPQRIPADVEEQAAMFRSLLSAKRVFMLLDNAESSQQVHLLLPGSPSCMAIVTSRNRLSGLIARHAVHRITVDVLSTADAVSLLAQAIGARRVTPEPEAAAELARLCGCLPLALRIASERAAALPHLSLTDIVTELSSERSRLDLLATDDEMTAVRAAFSWSYRALRAGPATAFRLLGLNPGPDISLAAASALTGTDETRTRSWLDALTGVHLLEEHIPGRYRFHDLIRIYAAELAAEEPEASRRAAVRRLLGWYLQMSMAADRVIAPRRRVPVDAVDTAAASAGFPGHGQALDWCEAERANLVAATGLAAEVGEDGIAWQLPIILGSFFNLRKHWADWITTHRVGAAAAGKLGNKLGQAWCLTGLGIAYGDLRRFDESVEHYRRAITLQREVGDRLGEAAALNNLGIAYGELHRHHEAIGCFKLALAICRKAGERRGEGMTLDSLGTAHRNLRQYGEAIACLHQALAICREIGDGRGEGFALSNLGDTYWDSGLPDEAIAHFRLAIEVRRAAGDRHGEAQTLDRLAHALQETGQRDDARRSWERAHAIFDELGDPQAILIRGNLDRATTEAPG